MTKKIKRMMAWALFVCLLMSCLAAAAEGTITVNMGSQPDTGLIVDPHTEVTFVLYRVGEPDGDAPSAWKSVVPGLELPALKDGKWVADDIQSFVDQAQLKKDSIARKSDAKTVAYDGSITFSDLAAGIYMGVATQTPPRLTVTPFIVAVPTLTVPAAEEGKNNVTAEDPYAVTIEVNKMDYVTPEPTALNGTKGWHDDTNFDGIQPESIEVQLMRSVGGASPEPTGTPKVVEDPWTYSFDNLPVSDADLNEYSYSVKETPVAGYTTEYDEGTLNIDNTHEVHYGALKITKEVTVAGKKPAGKFQNLADGVYTFHVEGPAVYPEGTKKTEDNYFNGDIPVTVTGGVAEPVLVSEKLMPGDYTITELPVDQDLHPDMVTAPAQTITVVKDTTKDTAALATFKNDQPLGSLRIRKNVTVDGQPTSGTLADGTYTFNITRKDGKNFTVDPVTVTIENGQSKTETVDNLLPGEYIITELGVDSKLHPDMIIASPQVVTVSGGSTENVKPAEMTNNQPVGGIKITKSVRSTGSATAADGTYTFNVTGPFGYKGSVKITISGGAAKSEVLNGLMPGEYTVHEDTSKLGSRVKLGTPNNVKVTVKAGVIATVGTDNKAEEASFRNDYTTPPPYNPPPETPTPTPSPTPTPTPTPTPSPTPSTNLSGRKVWNDESNAHRTRPNSITVQLLRDGVVVSSKSISGKGNTWSYSFNDLSAVDSNGNYYTYSVRETPVGGYTTTLNGTTITNDLIPQSTKEYTNFNGTKTWDDDNNANGERPNFITVRLLRDGVEVERRTVTAANGWQYSFTNVPVDDGYGNRYTYTIREDGVPGYFGRVTGLDLINTELPPPEEGIPDYRTPLAGFDAPEEELEELLDLFDYGTPLWGELLGTGDETPIYPYVFGGIGGLSLIALIVLLILGKKKKGEAA